MERHTHIQETQLMARMELHTPVQVTPLTGQMEVPLPALEIPPTILTAQLPHVQATPLTTLMEQLALVLAIRFIAIKVQNLSPNTAVKRDALERAPYLGR